MNKEEVANKLLDICSKLSEIEKHLIELTEITEENIEVKNEFLLDKIESVKSRNAKLRGEIIGITIPKINLNS